MNNDASNEPLETLASDPQALEPKIRQRAQALTSNAAGKMAMTWTTGSRQKRKLPGGRLAPLPPNRRAIDAAIGP
jgi:hypothetical protein